MPPIADSTNATPPGRGGSRWRYGDLVAACFAAVKRVPSTKFITDVGSSAKRLAGLARRLEVLAAGLRVLLQVRRPSGAS